MSREKFNKNKQNTVAFANGIKLLRKRHGLTQEDVAVKIGIKKPAMSLIESATTDPSLSSAAALASIFGLTPEQVMAIGQGESLSVPAAVVLPAWLDDLIPTLRELKPKEQELLNNFLKALAQ